LGHNLSGKSPEATPSSVSYDRISNFFAGGKTKANDIKFGVDSANLQDKFWRDPLCSTRRDQ
jgi:hypothetical protein